MGKRTWIGSSAAAALIALASWLAAHAASKATADKGEGASVSAKSSTSVGRLRLTKEQWKQRLEPEQYRVLREEGTEMAFTGKQMLKEHRNGTFQCAGCGLSLFRTAEKFDSGTGWPSFWQPIVQSHVVEKPETSLGMRRIEVECARCEGHLGHVFEDGPQPTGLRYCINSVSLSFTPAK